MFVKELVQCRLCRQLSLTVFVVGIAVATPVLLFSAHHLRDQQLESFDREAAARVAGLTGRPTMAGTLPEEGPERLASEVTALKPSSAGGSSTARAPCCTNSAKK